MRHIVSLTFSIFDKQNGYLPQDPAKGRTGDVTKEDLGVRGVIDIHADEPSGETPQRGNCKKESSEAAENSKALTFMMLNIYMSMMKIIISAPGMKDNEIEMCTLPEEDDPMKDPIARGSTH